VAIQVVAGISEGCVQAGCALVGGETAEMPGMYGPGHYDLAGFCVGAVERAGIIDGQKIQAGDALVGMPSTGVHSNGYSLVRRLVDDLDWSEAHGLGEPLADALLAPTRIYVQECLELARSVELRGLVHITGGGFDGNIPRILPEGLGARLFAGSWSIPPIFQLLERLGELTSRDMHRTFNNGLGMIAVVPAEQAEEAAALCGGVVVGETIEDSAQGVVVE
jgi:phosphoribosylformylglycinamidine cyclo-ligase